MLCSTSKRLECKKWHYWRIHYIFLSHIRQTLLSDSATDHSSKPIWNIEPSGKYFLTYVSAIDHSIGIGSTYHLTFVIPVVLISLLFNLLPPLLLTLYPIWIFRSCLLKCRLNFTIMHTFMDKVYGCYRNGLDGGRDMRFSGLYFFLGIAAYITMVLTHIIVTSYIIFINHWLICHWNFFLCHHPNCCNS